MKTNTFTVAIAVLMMTISGCINEEPTQEQPTAGDSAEQEKITNRIDVPASVRKNLGIRFAKVEKRIVSKTIRLPGTFELPPESTRVYTTRLAGQVELLVKQYQRVKVGDPLYRLALRDWPDAREELHVLQLEITQAELKQAQAAGRATAFADPAISRVHEELQEGFKSQIDSVRSHLKNLEAEKSVAKDRVSQLDKLAGKGAGNAAQLAEAKADLAAATSAISKERTEIESVLQSTRKFEAEVLGWQQNLADLERKAKAAENNTAALRDSLVERLRIAETRYGLKSETLTVDNWQTIEIGVVVSKSDGTVTDIDATSGQWLDAHETILTVKRLSQLRFRAHALQGDMGLIKDGQQASIVPPIGSSLEEATPVGGKTTIAPESDPKGRISEVLIELDGSASWARNGIRAEVEIIYDQTSKPQFAIPVRALVRDGLELVYFKRAPEDKDKVVREVASTPGPSDGVWMVLYGGLGPDTEVVIEGAYELMLSNDIPKGGHFHADGTWHAGDSH
ncbi:MAG: efflux RND transporter periplasmic adaptor subunit [Planctomycetota bacterium]|jgi:multidrug efflux pump subunit AcrA (membrane-fusion protein)